MKSMKIGERIKLIRKERNMTQKDLAAILKVSPAAISQFEKAEVLRSSTLEKLSYGLNVPVSFLLDQIIDTEEVPEGLEKIAETINQDTYEYAELASQGKAEPINPGHIMVSTYIAVEDIEMLQLLNQLFPENKEKAVDYIRYLLDRQEN